MELPKVTVDHKVIVVLAVLALVVSYTVYLENKKLRKALEERKLSPNERLSTYHEDTVIPVEPGTLKPEDVKPPSDIDEGLVAGAD